MKKYIFGLIVMTMVVITSAFTLPNKTAVQKSPATTYWFLMDSNGNVTTTQPTDLSSVCPAAGDGCAREYDASQTEVINGIRQVKQGQENLQIDSREKN